MKRSIVKIGKVTKILGEGDLAYKKVQKIIAVLLILSLTACEKAWYGQDGQPGDTYIALTWQTVEPSYIDAGTNAIPALFYWGEYYYIRPGFYNLYYEGSVWTGQAWARYAWEVTYEIFSLPGERGDWYYNGARGPDNFFTIECNPFGPYIGSSYKSAMVAEGSEILEDNEDEIIVKQTMNGVIVKITYKKTVARK